MFSYNYTLETPRASLSFFMLSSKNKHNNCPADMVFHPRKMLLTPSSGTFFHSSGFTLRYEEQVRQEHTDGSSQTATATYVCQALRCGAVSGDCFA